MLSIFSCACWPSVCLLWKNVYISFLPIFWLGCLGFFKKLSCMSSLYVLEIKPWLVTSSANIFSQSIGCLFFLFVVSFPVQKLISLISSHLFIYFFKKLFIYLFILFMAVLGLRFCARALSSCGKWGPLFIAVRGPFTVTASLVGEHRLQTCRLSNCGSRA